MDRIKKPTQRAKKHPKGQGGSGNSPNEFLQCQQAKGWIKAGGGTAAAIGGLAVGAVCVGTLGIGCAVAVGAVVVGTVASEFTDSVGDKVDSCAKIPSAELMAILANNALIKKIDSRLVVMQIQLVKLDGEIKKLSTTVKFDKFTDKIRIVASKYLKIQFDDSNGQPKTSSQYKSYVEAFKTSAIDTEPNIDDSLNRIWDMINGYGLEKSMYTQAYFCEAGVRQWYNMKIIEGYDLLYKAYAMRGFTDIKKYQEHELKYIIGNNRNAWENCGE